MKGSNRLVLLLARWLMDKRGYGWSKVLAEAVEMLRRE